MTSKDISCGGEHKGSKFAHITKVHPCYNEKLHDKVGRVHVPIAPKCNIGCNFCIRSINTEEDRPGVAGSIMDADAAVEHVLNVTKDSAITVVGVAGPGDSLANEATFEFFEKINKAKPDLIKCMSTNGLLLPKYADKIAELGEGKEAAEILCKNQLEGIKRITDLGVVVKVNIVLIPGLNDEHIPEIAKTVKECGADLVNVLPLIPLNKMADYPRPGCMEIEKARSEVEEYLPVFRACTQCRADAYGIPGKKHEDHHIGNAPQSHF